MAQPPPPRGVCVCVSEAINKFMYLKYLATLINCRFSFFSEEQCLCGGFRSAVVCQGPESPQPPVPRVSLCNGLAPKILWSSLSGILPCFPQSQAEDTPGSPPGPHPNPPRGPRCLPLTLRPLQLWPGAYSVYMTSGAKHKILLLSSPVARMLTFIGTHFCL